jgi:DNA-binding transcriptional LysR family regulator
MHARFAYSPGMDFDRLRAFVWSLEEGGIGAAARRLCRTQPAVSRMLQALEEQVGAELIDRRARPLRATKVGEQVLEHAREILKSADRLTDGSLRGRIQPQSVHLGVSRSLLWHLRDARFTRAAPPLSGTCFSVRSGWSPRLYRRFARGEFDGAMLLLPETWTADVPCRAERIRREPLVLIAPRPTHASSRRRSTVAELTGETWILNPDGCGFRHALATAFAGIGERLHVHFEIDAAPHEHLAMVAAGIGCSIVPASTLSLHPSLATDVQQVAVGGLQFDLAVWSVWTLRPKLAAGTIEGLDEIFATPATGIARRQQAS